MSGDIWSGLTRQHGKRCVVSISATDEEIAVETDRQVKVLFPHIKARMNGFEKNALDYGAGAGRFTRHLNRLLTVPFPVTVGYDPCKDLIDQAPITLGVSWETMPPERFFFVNRETFDLAFMAMVLCLPDTDVEATAEGLARVLAPNGMMVLLDHMADAQPPGKWVRWRSVGFYIDLFERYGVRLEPAAEDRQLDNQIVMLIGRKF